MRASRVIGMATSGMTGRSCHSHFHEVNPLKRHTLTREERWQDYQAWRESVHASKKRQRDIIAKGGRILPSLV